MAGLCIQILRHKSRETTLSETFFQLAKIDSPTKSWMLKLCFPFLSYTSSVCIIIFSCVEKQYALMPEWSKGVHSSCTIVRCVGSNPT